MKQKIKLIKMQRCKKYIFTRKWKGVFEKFIYLFILSFLFFQFLLNAIAWIEFLWFSLSFVFGVRRWRLTWDSSCVILRFNSPCHSRSNFLLHNDFIFVYLRAKPVHHSRRRQKRTLFRLFCLSLCDNYHFLHPWLGLRWCI